MLTTGPWNHCGVQIQDLPAFRRVWTLTQGYLPARTKEGKRGEAKGETNRRLVGVDSEVGADKAS